MLDPLTAGVLKVRVVNRQRQLLIFMSAYLDGALELDHKGLVLTSDTVSPWQQMTKPKQIKVPPQPPNILGQSHFREGWPVSNVQTPLVLQCAVPSWVVYPPTSWMTTTRTHLSLHTLESVIWLALVSSIPLVPSYGSPYNNLCRRSRHLG